MRGLFGSITAFGLGFLGCFRTAPPMLPPTEPPVTSLVQAAHTSGPRVGHPAPEIVGEDLDGVPFRLSDYRGKVVLLDFWGNW